MNRLAFVPLMLLAVPVMAQPWRPVRPGPGIPPHVSSTMPYRPGYAGPVRPVQPFPAPVYSPGWQPWMNRGWVNTFGIVPQNVYAIPNIRPPLQASSPNSSPLDTGRSKTRSKRPVRPQVLEFNEKTGRLEDVSPSVQVVSPPTEEERRAVDR